MRRVLLVAGIVTAAGALFGAGLDAAQSDKVGDLDGDGQATVLDLVRLISEVRGQVPLSAEQAAFSDVTGDSFVDQDDVTALTDRILERLPLETLPLTFIRESSPATGADDVAVTRETIIRFSIPLAENHGLDADSLFAEFGGVRLATHINVSPDRKTVTLFYDDILPASARVRVRLVGNDVLDFRGRAIDGDGDGVAGGDLVIDFDTLGLTVLAGTAVCGRVFASELTIAAAGTGGATAVNQPLEGAKITVDGMEDQIFAVTDQFGNFRLEPAPVGRFFVHVDGRTAVIDKPPGTYYPFVGKAWESLAGEEVNVGNIYLPLVVAGTLQDVSNTATTTIRLPESVRNAFPEFNDVRITVPAGSLFSDDGTRGGQVGLGPVDPNRLPGQLPPGLNFPLVITVQTDGATNFDQPAPVCFPNLPIPGTGQPLAPGAKSALWSFNHDTGRFEIVGSMTVSDDGRLVCTDPGVGILAPGWHGSIPGAVVSGGVLSTQTGGASTTVEPGTLPGSTPPASPQIFTVCMAPAAAGAGNPNASAPMFSAFFGQPKGTQQPSLAGFSSAESKTQLDFSGGGGTDPVHYFSGEFHLSAVDLMIKGRGMDFIWSRKYRSRTGPNTAQGNGWDFSYNVLLIQDGADLVVCDGNSRADRYKPAGTDRWAREEFFRDLKRNTDGSFVLEFEDQGKWIFNSFTAAAGPGRIAAIEDRNGNRMEFFYDAQHRLIRVNDTLDRDITISYNAAGFISALTDFAGRTVSYAYYNAGDTGGGAGDLKSCISPAVTGTPHGNDFPAGKTATYTYTTGFADERLNHNLLTSTDGRRNHPADATFGTGPFLVNSYAATQDPADLNFDRVVRQAWGGGLIDLVYLPLAPYGSSAAVTKTIVNDRAGNVAEYFYDARNRLVLLREFTGRANPALPTSATTNRPVNKLRSSDPDYFETRYFWNDDSLLTELVRPNGNRIQYIYESDLNPAAPTRTRGNLRIVRRLPGAHTPAGDQAVIEELFEYDTGHACGGCGFNFVTRHVDGRGNETRMVYDARGNLVRTTHRIGTIIEENEYNAFGQLTARILPDNGSSHRRRDAFTYFDSGSQRGFLQQQVIDAGFSNLTSTFAYDAVGNVVSVTDARGHDMQLVYNQLDQVVRTISREVSTGSGVRHQRDYSFDANNNLVRLDVQNVDETGVVAANAQLTTTWDYDILDYPIRRTDEVDGVDTVVAELTYDPNRNLASSRKGEAVNGNQPANVVSYVWDERNLLFTQTGAPGTAVQSTIRHDYDGNRNLVAVRQGIEDTPRVSTFAYDGFDRQVGRVDPMGNSVAMVYDANGNIVGTRVDGELTDIAGSATNVRLGELLVTYDPLDRAIATTTAFFDLLTGQPIGDGQATFTIGYTGLSDVAAATDDNGRTATRLYDTVGRVRVVTDPKGNTQTLTYDANSNVTTMLAVEKHDLGAADQSFTTSFTYDNLDRRTSVTDNVGSTSTIAYDSRNNPVKFVDAFGNLVRHSYDGLNRRLATTRFLTDNGLGSGNPAGQIVVQNVWDDSHRLVQRIDSNGNATTTTFDVLDRPVAVTFADGTTRTVAYDVHHNVTLEQDANGSVVASTYDLLDRVTARNITPGPGVSSDTTAESFAYDGLSRVVRAQDNDSLLVRRFDSLSNLIAETLDGQTTTSTFDGVGNLLTCTYPGGRRIEYVYDALDRKSILRDITSASSPSEIARFHYVGPARLARRDYGNGTRTDFVYDGITGIPNPAGDFGERRIVGMSHTRVADGATIANLAFTWDRMGNKTSRVDLGGGGIAQAFDYDSAYRMVESVAGGASTVYTTDAVNNFTAVTGAQNPGAYTRDATTPEPADTQLNQYSTTPQGARVHDKNGNVTSDAPGRTISYDYANRMVGFAAADTTASYRYDALGRRIAKAVDGATTRFFYGDIARIVEEQDAGGATSATYAHGGYIDDVVEMRRNGQAHFLHTDDLHSTVALSNVSGGVAETTTYGDYGKPAAASAAGNPWLFTGRHYDPETGFYEFRTRYLDPLAGRFTGRDTIGIWGDPFNLGNGFTYAGNNPFSGVDPYGLSVRDTLVSGATHAAYFVWGGVKAGVTGVVVVWGVSAAAAASPILGVGAGLTVVYVAGRGLIETGRRITAGEVSSEEYAELAGGLAVGGLGATARGRTFLAGVRASGASRGAAVGPYLQSLRGRLGIGSASGAGCPGTGAVAGTAASVARTLENTPLGEQITTLADDHIVHFSPSRFFHWVRAGGGGEVFTYRWGDIKHLTPKWIRHFIGGGAQAGGRNGPRYMHVLDAHGSSSRLQQPMSPGGPVEWVYRGAQRVMATFEVLDPPPP